MSTAATIGLYDMLRVKLGENEARIFVQNFEERFEEKFAEQKDILATKQDIADLRVQMAQLEGRLQAQIAESKSDMIKWMFGFFITLALMIVGLYLK